LTVVIVKFELLSRGFHGALKEKQELSQKGTFRLINKRIQRNDFCLVTSADISR